MNWSRSDLSCVLHFVNRALEFFPIRGFYCLALVRARKPEYWKAYRRSQNWSENVFSRVHSRVVAFAIVRTNSSRYWVYQNWLEKDGNRKFYDFLRMKSYGRSHGIFIEWKCKMKQYEKTWQQCYFGVQYILVREYFISWMNKHSRNSRNVLRLQYIHLRVPIRSPWT